MNINPSPIRLLAITLIVFLSVECASVVSAQTLFPDPFLSKPVEGSKNADRSAGRKGLLYRFKFFNAANMEDDAAGFPLNLMTAKVSLTIGGAPVACTPGINPSPNTCSFTTVDGLDHDGAQDTVKIFYNGDFPANTQIQYSVTGAESANKVQQDPTLVAVSFTTGASVLREPLDIELVFDISGSMAWPAAPGGTITRMKALKDASQSLFGLLSDYAMLGDKIGVVYFSDVATVFDQTPGGSNLKPAHDSAQTGLIAANIQTQTPTSNTSIGAGLRAADDSGFAADKDPNAPKATKLVVLFSDGEQNTAPLVGFAGGNLQVGGVNYDNTIKVCPVTAGVDGPGAELQQDIANARCNGRYIQVRDDVGTFVIADLETFFMQVFSDTLIGDKLELVKDVTGKLGPGTDLKQKFSANANDVALSILLSWSPDQELPAFRLIAPDGTLIDLSQVTKQGRNMRFTTIHFPLLNKGGAIRPEGEWTIELSGKSVPAPGLDYHLIVMLDNSTIASEFSATIGNGGTGDPIHLQVKMTDGGVPVRGARVITQVEAPVTGLGDILSTAEVSDRQPDPKGDKLRSAAQAKLLALITDPAFAGLFKSQTLPVINLLDNGNPANGDAVAGDGIYSALFRNTMEEGHYHFAMSAAATTPDGPYQRARQLSVFVRPKIDPDNTDFQLVSIASQQTGEPVVRLRLTPRDRLGNLLGPDYLDRLTIMSSLGTDETMLEDKLNGSYEKAFRLPTNAADPTFTVEFDGRPVLSKRLSELNIPVK